MKTIELLAQKLPSFYYNLLCDILLIRCGKILLAHFRKVSLLNLIKVPWKVSNNNENCANTEYLLVLRYINCIISRLVIATIVPAVRHYSINEYGN